MIGEAVTGYIGARRNLAGLEPRRSTLEMQETPPSAAGRQDRHSDTHSDAHSDTPSDTHGSRASAHDLLMQTENEFRRSDR